MTGGADGAVRLWTVDDEPTEVTSFEPGGDPTAIAVHPNGDRLLVAADDGSLVMAAVRRS